MKFNLATLARRARNIRRPVIILREIAPPAVMATDLYRALYRPVVQAWEAGLPRIMAEYERSLSQMTTDSAEDLQSTMESIAQEVSRLYLELTPRLRDWVLRVERYHRGKWRGAVLSATGVDILTLIGPADVRETLGTVIARNVALVRNVSDEAQGRISDAVFRGLSERKPAREVAREVRGAVDMARARSVRIASDQLAKAASALDTERMREAGIEKWEWAHSRKAHPRQEHVARNGKRYTFDKPPPDMPGEKPFCGCRKRAVVEFD